MGAREVIPVDVAIQVGCLLGQLYLETLQVHLGFFAVLHQDYCCVGVLDDSLDFVAVVAVGSLHSSLGDEGEQLSVFVLEEVGLLLDSGSLDLMLDVGLSEEFVGGDELGVILL